MTSLTEGGTEVIPGNRAELVQRACVAARGRGNQNNRMTCFVLTTLQAYPRHLAFWSVRKLSLELGHQRP
jgi:hypothetical protein